jgi:uncharacterized membrane protein
MRNIFQFLKSTVLGGLVVLVPVVVLCVLVGWAIGVAIKVIVPVFQWLPDQSVGGVSLTVLAAVGSLIGVCFVAGLCAELAVVRHLRSRAEQFALFVPGYALMKDVGASFIGVESSLKTVLVRFEDSWQLGFQMETLTDGRHVIFVPGVPKAMVGTLHIMAADRVQVMTMSVSAALDVLSRLGVGLGKSWPNNTDVLAARSPGAIVS